MRYLEEGENCSLTEPGGDTEGENVETEGDGLTGLVLLAVGHLQEAEEADGGAQYRQQHLVLAGTLYLTVEDKQGEHEEAQSAQQAGAPCRHDQVARTGGCNKEVRLIEGLTGCNR